MKLPGIAWRTIHRIQNRWWDARAVTSGYCNARSNPTGVPGESAGYTHWRCALKRAHEGKHRFRNAVWGDDLRITHEPVQSPPGQPWDRRGTLTLRQERARRHWLEGQWAQMRERRREAQEV